MRRDNLKIGEKMFVMNASSFILQCCAKQLFSDLNNRLHQRSMMSIIFIPWSFVMNDELWNLMSIDSSLKSSKSNKLLRWEPFFSDN